MELLPVTMPVLFSTTVLSPSKCDKQACIVYARTRYMSSTGQRVYYYSRLYAPDALQRGTQDLERKRAEDLSGEIHQ